MIMTLTLNIQVITIIWTENVPNKANVYGIFTTSLQYLNSYSKVQKDILCKLTLHQLVGALGNHKAVK